MLRKLLTVVLPLALPLLIYWGYVLLARRNARLAGAGQLPRWQEAPWAWIIVSGVLLMAATLIAVRLTSGVTPETEMVPPRYLDGVVVPSHPAE